MVDNKAISYINRDTPLKITNTEIDLDNCYKHNEIIVEVHAVALNPIDNILKRLSIPLISRSYSKIYGCDYSGVIVRAGKDVKSFNVGDAVFGKYLDFTCRRQGAAEQYIVINPTKNDEISVIEKGDGKEVSQETFNKYAAAVTVFATAYCLLTENNQKINENSKILVVGASTSVGYALIKIAKNIYNVKTVVGTCNSNSIEHNKEAGYDILIPYNDPSKSVPEYTLDIIKDQLDGEKFDLIADCAGTNVFFPIMDSVLKPSSTNSQFLTIVGDYKFNYRTMGWSDFVTWSVIKRKLGIFRNYNYGFIVANSPEGLRLASKMIPSGDYIPVIDSVYKFDQFKDAEERLISNKAKGKIIIEIDQ
ncbi:hypothetical protein TPHA_0G01990 [Tetrapisispora phaffii CBS 4417]|uniref:Alcohol dehydrogenase-like N-terminal domain-containing protein n=1 Tax=Tetrapisispora phaffii (strain ATCC 24235 / CBS 4417 / NBRC 1672 / NRRL Y-8282 / UCD 70-5) TaxID=1071381 RepID=G8BVV7_TETPH|nr:hypothetical protein TPHA_0G01990 [Tetrapisispora phaffii CBS 4417]CCE64035.1 hypothetical protein TPHA_0G01990 [Tetrapisispora phaffii CBS 4417]